MKSQEKAGLVRGMLAALEKEGVKKETIDAVRARLSKKGGGRRTSLPRAVGRRVAENAVADSVAVVTFKKDKFRVFTMEAFENLRIGMAKTNAKNAEKKNGG